VGGAALACVLGAAALAACDSGGGSASTTSSAPPTTTTTRPKLQDATADLTITGDRSAVLTGAAATCNLPRAGAPKYELKGADFPALGPEGFVEVEGPITVGANTVPGSVQIVIDDVGFISPPDGSGLVFSRSNELVTLDALLSGGPHGGSGSEVDPLANDLHARITGTIRCTG
jgi:hypothetical protein